MRTHCSHEFDGGVNLLCHGAFSLTVPLGVWSGIDEDEEDIESKKTFESKADALHFGSESTVSAADGMFSWF